MDEPVNPENPPAQPTYVVPPNTDAAKLQAGVSTSLRDIAVVISFGTAILGFVNAHDLIGAINYLQSAAALPAIALLCGLAVSAWRWRNARRQVKVTALAATSRPNSVVQVKES